MMMLMTMMMMIVMMMMIMIMPMMMTLTTMINDDCDDDDEGSFKLTNLASTMSIFLLILPLIYSILSTLLIKLKSKK